MMGTLRFGLSHLAFSSLEAQLEIAPLALVS